jgi:TetR/AcrR family transcriptional regulator, mexJK operon transcriptional repressor
MSAKEEVLASAAPPKVEARFGKPAGQASEAGEPLNAKARKILEGARSAFHELGFEGASVDEIARRAGVSKPTLYTYFGDKEALFKASFSNECQGYAASAFESASLGDGESLEAGLRGLARKVVAYLVSSHGQSMFRSAVAEAGRFPALGRAYYEAGPEKTTTRLVSLLREAVSNGILAIDDLELAAHQFMVLLKADVFHKRLFFVGGEPSQKDVNRVADGAVKLFFDGYRKRH